MQMDSGNYSSTSSRRDSAFASIHSFDDLKSDRRLSASTCGTPITDDNTKSVLPAKSTAARESSDNDAHHPYGEADRCVGSGTSATVIVFRKHHTLYAVKQFRPRNKPKVSVKSYTKKLMSEYCIASSLSHPNIVYTFDLLQDCDGRFSTVMEYCDNGDLFSAITNGNLSTAVKWDYFGQLVAGLAYLHKVGVAHRDIKPENLLLTKAGQLKISDFGVSDVFRMPWETRCHKSFDVAGSEPYVAPEVFSNGMARSGGGGGYWGAGTDVWSAGIVLYCLFAPGFCWRRAALTDRGFYVYLCNYKSRTYDPFASLTKHSKEIERILYLILDPNPATRVTSERLLLDPFIAGLKSPSLC